MQRKTTNSRNRGGKRSHASSSPGLWTAAIGIAGGIGVGAAVMYLLDPNQGERRRQRLAQKASDAAHGAWDTVSEHAAGAGAALASAMPAVGGKVMEHLHGAGDRAEDARHAASGWMRSARARLSDRVAAVNPFDRHHIAPAAIAATSTGLAALAIGATAMYLFDPTCGRGRRAWIGQKVHRVVHETGHFMRATGRHLANKGQGYYHETRSAAEGAVDSAMSKLGHPRATPAPDPAVPRI
jgi:gas vesicle protein